MFYPTYHNQLVDYMVAIFRQIDNSYGSRLAWNFLYGGHAYVTIINISADFKAHVILWQLKRISKMMRHIKCEIKYHFYELGLAKPPGASGHGKIITPTLSNGM